MTSILKEGVKRKLFHRKNFVAITVVSSVWMFTFWKTKTHEATSEAAAAALHFGLRQLSVLLPIVWMNSTTSTAIRYISHPTAIFSDKVIVLFYNDNNDYYSYYLTYIQYVLMWLIPDEQMQGLPRITLRKFVLRTVSAFPSNAPVLLEISCLLPLLLLLESHRLNLSVGNRCVCVCMMLCMKKTSFGSSFIEKAIKRRWTCPQRRFPSATSVCFMILSISEDASHPSMRENSLLHVGHVIALNKIPSNLLVPRCSLGKLQLWPYSLRLQLSPFSAPLLCTILLLMVVDDFIVDGCVNVVKEETSPYIYIYLSIARQVGLFNIYP